MHIAFNRNQINPKKEDKKAGKSGRKIRKQTFFLKFSHWDIVFLYNFDPSFYTVFYGHAKGKNTNSIKLHIFADHFIT